MSAPEGNHRVHRNDTFFSPDSASDKKMKQSKSFLTADASEASQTPQAGNSFFCAESLTSFHNGDKKSYCTLYIKEGKDIPIMDKISRSADPYCKIFRSNGQVLGRTRTIFKSLTPVWEPASEFSFEILDKEKDATEIKIEVWDKDRVVDDFIGNVFLTIPHIASNYTESWVDIKKQSKKAKEEKFRGQLLMGFVVSMPLTIPCNFISNKNDAEICQNLKQEIDPMHLFLAMPKVTILMKRKARAAKERLSKLQPVKTTENKMPSSESDQLNIRLVGLGLEQLVSVGDGNCQFRSFSQQLYGTQDYYDLIRKAVVNWMRTHPESFNFYFETEAGYESYLQKMDQDREWGDEMTLKAMSDMLSTEVHVVSSTMENWYLTYGNNDESEESSQKKKIFLAYVSPVHYNSLSLLKKE